MVYWFQYETQHWAEMGFNSDTCYNIEVKLRPKGRHNNKVMLNSRKSDSDFMRDIYDVTLDSPSF